MGVKMNKQTITKNYDIIIVGGGISGVCAAISAARHNARTALIQNRPVLGGNASSEIRMHICGADVHGGRPDARETGILEEILLENKRINPQYSFSILDTVLWEKCRFQEGLDLYLNTHMTEVVTENNEIKKIITEQLTTEKVFEIEAKIYVDATGDGTLAYLAGAEYMCGREGKSVYGEKYAPDESDNVTMGNTLLFKAVDAGKAVPFEKPFWANHYTEEDLAFRGHDEITYGYWWIELGGDELDIVADGEVIRDELLKAIYGVWNHIKNSGDHNADNYVLDWVGFLPGKRESRRIKGAYILKEQDLLNGKVFEDAVAYGGWPMDMHVVGGLKAKLEPTDYIHLDNVYTIPYRSLYSKDIKNLMLGGRAISSSHMAFGSNRVMATCAVVGQAVGTAGAMAIEKGILPADVSFYISELQQTLLKDDCYIPGYKNEDAADIAKTAKISCSSATEDGHCENVINGTSRRIKEQSNCWISNELASSGEWLGLTFNSPISVKEIHLKFDSNLSKELMLSMSHHARSNQVPGIPPELVKDYGINFYLNGKQVGMESITDNYYRFKVHKLETSISCDKIVVNVLATHGDKHGRIFEIRVY
jgi:ribulose 1,5-bisphosphate synthetase/thiazole synthase